MRDFQAKGVDGMVLYAVGDIHGRADLLRELLTAIRLDARTMQLEERPFLLFVGDYVDRGPDSRAVLDMLIAEQGRGELQTTFIRGNHDDYLLDFLGDCETGPRWMDVGGAATMRSYGVAVPRLRTDLKSWSVASSELRSAIPREHVEFLAATRFMAIFGDYLFVHAGVRPGIPLERQTALDVTTIRRKFLSCEKPIEGKRVVFGHTPFEKPYLSPYKIGIDTGAYVTGVLTAVRISGYETKFMSAANAKT